MRQNRSRLHRLHESHSLAAEERGFSNCTGGKEELELRMRNTLHLTETSRATTKSNKLVDSASLGRPPVVPLKCAAPVSPSSVCCLGPRAGYAWLPESVLKPMKTIKSCRSTNSEALFSMRFGRHEIERALASLYRIQKSPNQIGQSRFPRKKRPMPWA
jgi:hypothetical protein